MSPPLPSQKTMPSIRNSWLGRHSTVVGAAAGLVSTSIATLLASGLKPDPETLARAFKTYGLPTGLCVCLLMVIGWMILVLLPRRDEAMEERYRRQEARHVDEMAHRREVESADREREVIERARDRELYREMFTSLLRAHDTAREEHREEIREVRSQVERIHDRLDTITSGQFARVKKAQGS